MKDSFILITIIILGLVLFNHHPKANWPDQRAQDDPQQNTNDLPSAWPYKNFTITPKAHYSIKAVVMSKHSYWGGSVEDSLAYYDLALGWGSMSNAEVINQLHISQGSRWYNYYWSGTPPIPPGEIISHSANTHIVPAGPEVFKTIQRIKQYDVVSLQGYLIDIDSQTKDWHWRSSLTRLDSGAGSCELFWVTDAKID